MENRVRTDAKIQEFLGIEEKKVGKSNTLLQIGDHFHPFITWEANYTKLYNSIKLALLLLFISQVIKPTRRNLLSSWTGCDAVPSEQVKNSLSFLSLRGTCQIQRNKRYNKNPQRPFLSLPDVWNSNKRGMKWRLVNKCKLFRWRIYGGICI